ncbi:sulfatase [Flavivirga abyssicola]|uniref:sulfatase family protein n=1 Tax=Flavivirga abyssicola TaxID=3063533 RepID=UPI0026DF6A12|nr:sulfatase [Flavivirga sp. MEBiC07777]WVK13799.1 sulfatase [Flavivirga sp. MEBiC07777]
MFQSKFSLILYIALFNLISSCNSKQAEPTTPPNIVWITSEDNSKHYMDLFDKHGTSTPNIEKLANHGIRFTHAFSNAAVCSAARSTLISGSYGPRLATHYHRKLQKVPMPEDLEMFPYYLRQAGYHTTNNSKEDYNIFKSDSVWDDSSKHATWKNRKPNQPFFHVFNIGTTHEGKLHFTEEDMKAGTKTNPDSTFVFPNHPQTELFKYTNALYLDKIKQMDTEVGQVVDNLEKEGLLENTFIFYFGDHGGVLPGSKGYLYETGLHVPLVVYIPPKYKNSINLKPNTTSNAFVSFVDFGPTVLNLAGAKIPKGIDGTPFLGKNITKEDLANKNETFSYADRFDEKYDMVRALRKGKYKYIRNYQAFNFDGLMNEYRYRQPGYKTWKNLYEAGKLNDIQSQFFQPKPTEALYDLEVDPYETNNLANQEDYTKILIDMRENLNSRVKTMPDLSFYPEFYLIKNAFENPVAFGQKHKAHIQNYIDIANLSLENFDSVKSKIENSLKSSDPWERYWGLITCSNFGKEAISLKDDAITISKTDSELINRVRAAEFLGLIGAENPIQVMTEALYSSEDSSEALLILNSMTLMKECQHKYRFNIDRTKLKNNILSIKLIKTRVDYLSS